LGLGVANPQTTALSVRGFTGDCIQTIMMPIGFLDLTPPKVPEVGKSGGNQSNI
jgi:hypothetical protein